MRGAFAGDFVGSRFEFFPNKSRDFEMVSESCRPTDDTILTIAVGDAIINKRDMGETLRMFAQSFPTSYGMHFREWFNGRLGSFEPYGSWGNGAAMRVSCTAHLATSFEECMELAELSAAITHNHPEGIRGAKAVAAAIYCGLSGWHRDDIRPFIERAFLYDLSSQSLEEVMLESTFDLSSAVSVPKALMCAFDAATVEDAIRNAVYLGGDSDTEGAIAGSIAETWSEPPKAVLNALWQHFPSPLRKRINAIQAQIDATERTPFTKEMSENLVLWDPKLFEEWDARIAAEEEARLEMIAAEEAEYERLEAERAAKSVKSARPRKSPLAVVRDFLFL